MSKQTITDTFPTKIMQYMKGHGINLSSKTVLVALSGGADSVCLFRVLLSLRERLDFELAAVHVNHGLRETALRDEAFVRQICEKHQVQLWISRVDVKEYAKKFALGIEEAARIVRYEEIEKARQSSFANQVALAHHMDDQAETVLFHMSRGCSLEGLRGILPVRDCFIRPLLGVSRKEIEEYLATIGQPFVTDETNEDTTYTRNLLRKDIIPKLTDKVCHQTVQHISQMADDMTLLEDYLKEQMELVFANCVSVEEFHTPKQICIWIEELKKLHPYMQNYLLKQCLCMVSQTEKDIARVHIKDLRDLCEKQTGRAIDLPYNIRVQREYDRLVLQKKDQQEDTDVNFEVILQLQDGKIPFEKSVVLPDGRTLILRIFQRNPKTNIPIKTYTKWFDYAKINKSLVVRTPRQADYFMLDQEHKKLLKDYLKNEKIPASERKRQLVVAMDHHILYVVGGRISEAFKVTDETQVILEISVE